MPLVIMVNVMMTMTVVVLHEASQDICAALENSPRHAGYLASDIYSVFGLCNDTTLECNQCENTSNPRHAGCPEQDSVFLQRLYRSMTFCNDTLMLAMVNHFQFTKAPHTATNPF